MKAREFRIVLSNSAGELDSLRVLAAPDSDTLNIAMRYFVSELEFADGDVLTVKEITS